MNSAATTKELSDFHGIVLPLGTKYQRKLLRNAVLPVMGEYILNSLTNNKTPSEGGNE